MPIVRCERRFARDLLGVIQRDTVKLRRRHGAIDETHTLRRRGVDAFAGQQHLHGCLAGNRAREGDHGRRTKESDIHARGGEVGLIGGDGQIAGRHQLTAGGGRDAVDLRNNGLGQAGDGEHHPAALLENGFKIGAAISGAHFLQVMPGAKALSGRLQDHDLYRAVLAQVIQRGLHLAHEAGRKGVVLPGPVQGERGNAAGIAAQQDGLVAA